MMNYRKITLYIDEGTGELIDECGEKLIWENSLPKLLLADTVIWECHFMEQQKNNEDWQVKVFPEYANFRIIGNIGTDNTATPIFSAESLSEYSDLQHGIED